jgi:glycine cleavage system H protein
MESELADFDIPKDLRFTREDEWVRKEDDQWVIGVSDYAQQQLGDIVFVELPAVGTALTRGESFGVIESVKAVSDLYAPISGKVVAINEELEERPEVVNESCYHDGWLITIEGAESEELETLMDADAYQQFVEERAD